MDQTKYLSKELSDKIQKDFKIPPKILEQSIIRQLSNSNQKQFPQIDVQLLQAHLTHVLPQMKPFQDSTQNANQSFPLSCRNSPTIQRSEYLKNESGDMFRVFNQSEKSRQFDSHRDKIQKFYNSELQNPKLNTSLDYKSNQSTAVSGNFQIRSPKFTNNRNRIQFESAYSPNLNASPKLIIPKNDSDQQINNKNTRYSKFISNIQQQSPQPRGQIKSASSQNRVLTASNNEFSTTLQQYRFIDAPQTQKRLLSHSFQTDEYFNQFGQNQNLLNSQEDLFVSDLQIKRILQPHNNKLNNLQENYKKIVREMEQKQQNYIKTIYKNNDNENKVLIDMKLQQKEKELQEIKRDRRSIDHQYNYDEIQYREKMDKYKDQLKYNFHQLYQQHQERMIQQEEEKLQNIQNEKYETQIISEEEKEEIIQKCIQQYQKQHCIDRTNRDMIKFQNNMKESQFTSDISENISNIRDQIQNEYERVRRNNLMHLYRIQRFNRKPQVNLDDQLSLQQLINEI